MFIPVNKVVFIPVAGDLPVPFTEKFIIRLSVM